MQCLTAEHHCQPHWIPGRVVSLQCCTDSQYHLHLLTEGRFNDSITSKPPPFLEKEAPINKLF